MVFVYYTYSCNIADNCCNRSQVQDYFNVTGLNSNAMFTVTNGYPYVSVIAEYLDGQLAIGVSVLQLCSNNEWVNVSACGKYFSANDQNETLPCADCSNYYFGCFSFTLIRCATLNLHAESESDNLCMIEVLTEPSLNPTHMECVSWWYSVHFTSPSWHNCTNILCVIVRIFICSTSERVTPSPSTSMARPTTTTTREATTTRTPSPTAAGSTVTHCLGLMVSLLAVLQFFRAILPWISVLVNSSASQSNTSW